MRPVFQLFIRTINARDVVDKLGTVLCPSLSYSPKQLGQLQHASHCFEQAIMYNASASRSQFDR